MPDSTTIPALPPMPENGNALYDMIMGEIDPELTSAQVNGLLEKYKDEMPEQRAERAKRYERAFALYNQRFAEYNAYWSRQFNAHKRASIASLEAEHRMHEDVALNTLDLSMSAL